MKYRTIYNIKLGQEQGFFLARRPFLSSLFRAGPSSSECGGFANNLFNKTSSGGGRGGEDTHDICAFLPKIPFVPLPTPLQLCTRSPGTLCSGLCRVLVMIWEPRWWFRSFLVPPTALAEPGTLSGQGEGWTDGWPDRWGGRRSQGTCCDGGAAPKNPFLIIALISCFPTPRGCRQPSRGGGVCAGVLGRGGEDPEPSCLHSSACSLPAFLPVSITGAFP